MLFRAVPDREEGAARSLFTFRLPQVRHSGWSAELATRSSLIFPHSRQRKSKRGMASSFSKERVEISLCRLIGVSFLVLFDGLLQGFNGKADAVLLLVRNLNQSPEDVSVLDFQSLRKSLPPDEIDQGHGS